MTDHRKADPQLPLFPDLAARVGDFVSISSLVQRPSRRAAANFLTRLQKIQAAHRRSKPVEQPIGSDDPVERYPDAELPG